MKTNEIVCEPKLKCFRRFCAEIGISPVTGWRFRKRGWIDTVNIGGRPYITAEEIDRFTRRASSGEFATT